MRAKLYTNLERFVRRFLPELRIDPKSLRYLLMKQAVESSAEFVQREMIYAEPFETREGLYKYIMTKISLDGLILEFGVHNGNSINAIAALTEGTVHGFDSFEGLPDDGQIPTFTDGGVKWYAGKIDSKGRMPEVKGNVKLHKGWFDQVLAGFYEAHNGSVALMHLDCDIYSSTKFVLECSRQRIQEGSIIIFDEYMNFEGWRRHEHRALTEFAAETGLRYEFIAYTYLGGAAIKVLGFGKSKT